MHRKQNGVLLMKKKTDAENSGGLVNTQKMYHGGTITR